MGRIFPASTCIKSSTSRIYKSLASLALLLQDPSRPPYTDFWYQSQSNAHCDPESLSHRPCPDSLSDPSARSWTAQNAFLYPAAESASHSSPLSYIHTSRHSSNHRVIQLKRPIGRSHNQHALLPSIHSLPFLYPVVDAPSNCTINSVFRRRLDSFSFSLRAVKIESISSINRIDGWFRYATLPSNPFISPTETAHARSFHSRPPICSSTSTTTR